MKPTTALPGSAAISWPMALQSHRQVERSALKLLPAGFQEWLGLPLCDRRSKACQQQHLAFWHPSTLLKMATYLYFWICSSKAASGGSSLRPSSALAPAISRKSCKQPSNHNYKLGHCLCLSVCTLGQRVSNQQSQELACCLVHQDQRAETSKGQLLGQCRVAVAKHVFAFSTPVGSGAGPASTGSRTCCTAA